MSLFKKIVLQRDFAAGVLSFWGPLPHMTPCPPSHTLYTCIHLQMNFKYIIDTYMPKIFALMICIESTPVRKLEFYQSWKTYVFCDRWVLGAQTRAYCDQIINQEIIVLNLFFFEFTQELEPSKCTVSQCVSRLRQIQSDIRKTTNLPGV